jgi:hypothetical protein
LKPGAFKLPKNPTGSEYFLNPIIILIENVRRHKQEVAKANARAPTTVPEALYAIADPVTAGIFWFGVAYVMTHKTVGGRFGPDWLRPYWLRIGGRGVQPYYTRMPTTSYA